MEYKPIVLVEAFMRHFKDLIKENNLLGCGDLIDAGADINQQFNNGWTPLMYACHYGKYKIVNLLLKTNGIKVNVQNDSGRSALMIACYKDFIEIVKLIL